MHGNLVCGVVPINDEVTGFYKESVGRAGARFRDVPNFFKGQGPAINVATVVWRRRGVWRLGSVALPSGTF